VCGRVCVRARVSLQCRLGLRVGGWGWNKVGMGSPPGVRQ
jgi:hypothetical protein